MIKRKLKYNSLVLLSSLAILSSCGKKDPNSPGREYMPDMYYSEALKPYEISTLFKDSLEARKPVAGTISQGSMPNTAMSIDQFIYPFPNTPEGYEQAGSTLKNPLLKDSLVLEQGKEIYTKFCIQCHGESGDGNGSIVANGKFPNPGAYWTKEGLTQGKMFHTLTFGKGLMGSHASQLTKTERWKAVHWVQNLIDQKKPNTSEQANTDAKTAENKPEDAQKQSKKS